MKTRTVFAFVLLVAIAGTDRRGIVGSRSRRRPPRSQISRTPNAPSLAKPVKADDWVAFENGKVYFCCENCPAAFKKDSAKYAAKAHLQMVQTGPIEGSRIVL